MSTSKNQQIFPQTPTTLVKSGSVLLVDYLFSCGPVYEQTFRWTGPKIHPHAMLPRKHAVIFHQSTPLR